MSRYEHQFQCSSSSLTESSGREALCGLDVEAEAADEEETGCLMEAVMFGTRAWRFIYRRRKNKGEGQSRKERVAHFPFGHLGDSLSAPLCQCRFD